MKKIQLGGTSLTVPSVIVGCMRFDQFSNGQLQHFIHTALEQGACFFDHADIYGDGRCETLFGEAVRTDPSLHREDMILQSKCGIRKGFYDLSAAYIMDSVDGILQRLGTDYLDILLLHRPDALVEPEEVAEAFDRLQARGKVRYFGVSNHRPMQIELLKKYVGQSLLIDQLQFSLPVSGMVAGGMEVNMTTEGAADRDGSILDYARLHDMTIQAWSPFQKADWQGPFIGAEDFGPLNAALAELAGRYGTSGTGIAAAWILRHPAHMQLISGTTSEQRLSEIIAASEITLTREEWYQLYLKAGHILP